ncbi:hypothetical protein GCM10022217_25480 [Chryseobacterium ginsenosidimutans]|uniref:hypothetical protein n=1 Tax=Chryseobacterium ginsenosidimutans TaxID=687846 RepID=UPI0031D83C82
MKPQLNFGTLDDIEFPEILYKYRDWENPYNRRFIENKEVYLEENIFGAIILKALFMK